MMLNFAVLLKSVILTLGHIEVILAKTPISIYIISFLLDTVSKIWQRTEQQKSKR